MDGVSADLLFREGRTRDLNPRTALDRMVRFKWTVCAWKTNEKDWARIYLEDSSRIGRGGKLGGEDLSFLLKELRVFPFSVEANQTGKHQDTNILKKKHQGCMHTGFPSRLGCSKKVVHSNHISSWFSFR